MKRRVSLWRLYNIEGGGTQLVEVLCYKPKVAGSIPDGVTGIFHWHNPSSRTMALGSTQPLTEMSIRNISWGVKAAGAYRCQPYYLQALIAFKSVSLNLLKQVSLTFFYVQYRDVWGKFYTLRAGVYIIAVQVNDASLSPEIRNLSFVFIFP
jgi:hypothetical protein